ncbi:choice-of-anchor B family protein [Gemmatimonas aurantiaca]|nr:choice-of-anchor B family protein [Gemmatimonas aurantiaca]
MRNSKKQSHRTNVYTATLLALCALSGIIVVAVNAVTRAPSANTIPSLLFESPIDIPPEMNFLAGENQFDEQFLYESNRRIQESLKRGALAAPPISVAWSGGERWISGINWGGEAFFGSFAKGINFFGSSVGESEYVPVELRFTAGETTLCQTFRRPGYAAAGVGTFPGSAWDVSDTANPRRLNIGYVEWDDGAGANPAPDSIWNPNDNGGVAGKREYLFIFNSDYDGDGLTYQTTNIISDNPDVLYAWWPLVENGKTFLETDPFSLHIIPHYLPLMFTNLYGLPSQTEISLRWLYDGSPVHHVKLLSGASYPPTTVVDSFDATTTSVIDAGLVEGVEYLYQLKAYGDPVTVGCCDTPGDADNSSSITIADVTFLISHIFSGGLAPACAEEGDADNGGSITIGDVTYLIARIFSGGPAPTCDPPTLVSPEIGESSFLVANPQIVSANVTLVGAWHGRNTYGDCWGYTDGGGHEYALLCARNQGVSIIDIETSPPTEVGFISSLSPNKDAKDVKIYQNYAIVVKESEAVQIVDISDVTAPVTVASIFPPGGTGAHNCLVEGDFLYITGDHNLGGVGIYDISTPSAPMPISYYAPFYFHDIDIRNDTLMGAGIWGDGIDVVDISVKAAPTNISLFNYAGSGAHNIEYLGERDFVAVGDEIGSSGNHMRIFDISDIFNVIKVADIIVDPQAVVHNCYELDSILYIAHYTEGLQIFDVTDPTAPTLAGFYDSYPQSGYGYRGCWNVYPYFASGKIIISDLQTGLYVLEFTP